ncbi:MAG: hypothetical protein ACK4TA_05130 [Saprospiraceae bacterium]
MAVQTLEIHVPDSISQYLEVLASDKEEFVLEAIQEKIDREKRKNLDALLIEGYQATAKEDLDLTKDFETADFENI